MMQNQPGQGIKFDRTPPDTISCIAANNDSNNQVVCCTSWDNSLSIWRLNNSPNSAPQPIYVTTVKSDTKDAMLSCAFADNDIIIGTATGKILQIKNGETTTSEIGSHLGIVCGVRWCPNQKLVMSGSSYDYKINFWDTRDAKKPANSVDLQGKCKCFDVSNDKAVIVTSENKIYHYDLKSTDKKLKSFSSKINCPITSICISNDGEGYAAGGLYGVLEANIYGNGSTLIECHRDSQNVYPSNCVAASNISPKNVIISGGGNGMVEYFSYESAKSTKSERKMTQNCDPVTACTFLPRQKTYIIATGNDWSRGAEGAQSAPKPQMQIRMLNAKEISG